MLKELSSFRGIMRRYLETGKNYDVDVQWCVSYSCAIFNLHESLPCMCDILFAAMTIGKI